VANFHVYALEWTNNAIRWSVDDQVYESQSSWWSPAAAYPAPFNEPFYIIMNMAVGGNFVGSPTAATVFPGDMQVDYVRVYEWVEAPSLSITKTQTDGLLVTWPFLSPSYVLQQNSDLSSTNWTQVTNSPAVNPTNLQNQVVLPTSPGGGFFRLAN
jgi:beta-glucanase (GH16 family)